MIPDKKRYKLISEFKRKRRRKRVAMYYFIQEKIKQ